MVKIRLKRLGRKGKPFYRIVVTDIRNRRDGVPMAELGYYNPITKELKLNKAEALSWMAKGAIPTDTTKRLIEKAPETGELVMLEKRAKKAKVAAVVEAPVAVAVAAAPPEAPAAAEPATKAEEAAAPEEVVATPEVAAPEVAATEEAQEQATMEDIPAGD